MTLAPSHRQGLHEDPDNLSYYPDDGGTGPCNLSVPGFDNLGLVITYTLVFVFSVAGNGVVIYVVCCMAKRRTSTDIYLTNLALADLLFSLTLPFWAVDIHRGWIFGTALCKLVSGLQEASQYSGVFLLACISVDRRFAVVRPTRAKSPDGLAVKVACGAVWLVATLLSVPAMVQRRHMDSDNRAHKICYEERVDESSDRWYVAMHIVRHVLGFFLPLAVMAVCYSSTLVTLYHTRNRQKQKAIRVILAVVLAFVVCWLPYNAAVFVDLLIKSSLMQVESCDTLYGVDAALGVTKVLAFVHCAVNPVLYAFIGVKFRNQLLTICNKRGVSGNVLPAASKKSSVSSGGSSRSRDTSFCVFSS